MVPHLLSLIFLLEANAALKVDGKFTFKEVPLMCIQLTPSMIRRTLFRIIDTMKNNLDSFVLHPGRDFTRNRRLPFNDLILLMMSMEQSSIGGEIHRFFNTHYPKKSLQSMPTASAFIRQRAKLKDTFFLDLLKRFNEPFPFRKTKFGLHLLACDGTDLNIPADEDPDTFIPFNSNNGGYYQFHTTAFLDLLERRYSDAVIQPRALVNENDAFVTLVNRNSISGPCLFIADRGFDAFNSMAAVAEKKQFFLFRLKEPDSKVSPFRHLVRSDKAEDIIDSEFFLSRSTIPLRSFPPQQCRKLRANHRFDFIPPDDMTSVFRLPFRFVYITLDNGTREYLITNLPKSYCTLSDFKELYRLRWGIETSFLFLKHNLCLDTPHSIRRDFLRQEIFVKLLMYNFCSLLASTAGEPAHTKRYSWRISFSSAIRTARLFLISFFVIPDSEIIADILRHKYPVRTDKNRPRKMRSQRLKHLQNRA